MTTPLLLSGVQFADLRKQAKMSVRRLSIISNVNEFTIRRFEAGENITISTYRQLLDGLAKYKQP